MINSINAVFNFILELFGSIGGLYVGSTILSAALGLVVLRWIVNIFKRLMP